MAKNKPKILLVDDEPNLLKLLHNILKDEGFNVKAINNGKEALKVAGTFKPDLVILDMMMPGLSGVDVCQRLRDDKATRYYRVVFLTVVRFSEAGMNVLKEFGVIDYITKPFETKELIKRIKKALKQETVLPEDLNE